MVQDTVNAEFENVPVHVVVLTRLYSTSSTTVYSSCGLMNVQVQELYVNVFTCCCFTQTYSNFSWWRTNSSRHGKVLWPEFRVLEIATASDQMCCCRDPCVKPKPSKYGSSSPCECVFECIRGTYIAGSLAHTHTPHSMICCMCWKWLNHNQLLRCVCKSCPCHRSLLEDK